MIFYYYKVHKDSQKPAVVLKFWIESSIWLDKNMRDSTSDSTSDSINTSIPNNLILCISLLKSLWRDELNNCVTVVQNQDFKRKIFNCKRSADFWLCFVRSSFLQIAFVIQIFAIQLLIVRFYIYYLLERKYTQTKHGRFNGNNFDLSKILYYVL